MNRQALTLMNPTICTPPVLFAYHSITRNRPVAATVGSWASDVIRRIGTGQVLGTVGASAGSGAVIVGPIASLCSPLLALECLPTLTTRENDAGSPCMMLRPSTVGARLPFRPSGRSLVADKRPPHYGVAAFPRACANGLLPLRRGLELDTAGSAHNEHGSNDSAAEREMSMPTLFDTLEQMDEAA